MTKCPTIYLSYDGITDSLGQSQVLPYIIGLCEAGHEFHLVSFEKPENFKEGEQVIRELIKGHAITWHPQTYHKRPPVVSTVLDLRRMWHQAKAIHQAHSIELVHSRSYLAGLIGLKLKKRFGIKFLFDIRGFWADERVDGNIWNLKNPLYRLIYKLFKRKEIEMMHRADHVISLTHAGKEEIVSGNLFQGKSSGLMPEKITVIPCAVDLELFDPAKIKKADQAALKKRLELENTVNILVYLGSLGTWYLLDEMLLYFKDYQKEHPGSCFLFVTKDDPEIILAGCDKYEIDQQSIRIQPATRQEVPLFLSIATLGIFFIKTAYSKKASSATKMGEMMAMGLNMVCNEIGDVGLMETEIIQEETSNSVVRIDSCRNAEKLKEYDLMSGIDRYSIVYERDLA